MVLALLSILPSTYLYLLLASGTNLSGNSMELTVLGLSNLGLFLCASIFFIVAGITSYRRRRNEPFRSFRYSTLGAILLCFTLVPAVLSLFGNVIEFNFIRGGINQFLLATSVTSFVNDFLTLLFFTVGLYLLGRAIVGNAGKKLFIIGFAVLMVEGLLEIFNDASAIIQFDSQTAINNIGYVAVNLVPDFRYVTEALYVLGLILVLIALLFRKPMDFTETSRAKRQTEETESINRNIVVEPEQKT